jgi:hypothetical protein
MQMQKTLDTSIPIMLNAMLMQNSKLIPFKGVMLDFISKHMSYVALKPAYVELYSREFTADELVELTAFYSTETGKKYIQKQPSLFEQASQIGRKSVENNMAELEKVLSDEMVRIQLEEAQE